MNHEVVRAIALVGFDDLEEFRDLESWVAAFVVKPEAGGSGIATAMLDLLERKAGTPGIKRLYLWTEDQTASSTRPELQVRDAFAPWPLSFDLLSKELDQ